jgi:hypothetical protein
LRKLHAIVLAFLASSALLGSSCGPGGPPSLVPADYRTRFVQVRNCRATFEHMNPSVEPPPRLISNIVVYVNPEAAEAYRNNQNPLPANTLVIKEEHADPGCTDLVGLSVMRKEPGFDTTRGDWHWQHVVRGAMGDRVDADGRVERCATSQCHAAPECLMRDWMCTQP